MARYVGYVRVSRVKGRKGDSFISPKLQREAIAGWAAGEHEIVEYFEDLDVSGGRIQRPGLARARKLIKAKRADGIVVAKLDRLSRAGVAEALTLIESIEKDGGQVISVDEPYDPTPAGAFTRTTFLALARMQREQLGAGYRTAQKNAVERGIHLSSKSPTGYSKNEDRILEPNQFGPAITDLFRRKAGGASLRELSDFLNSEGVVSPYGNTGWTGRAIQGIIKNRVYLGEARGGPRTDPYVMKDAHEPLVTVRIWNRANKQRPGSTPNIRGTEGSLLNSLLRCAGCRYVMKADKMALRNGERVRIYRCRGKHATGLCQARSAVLGSVIEPFVTNVYLDAFDDMVGEPVTDAALTAAEDLLHKAQDELDDYLGSTMISIVGNKIFEEQARLRVRKVEEAATELERLRPQSLSAVGIRDEWKRASVMKRNQLLAGAMDAVMLYRGRGKSIEARTKIIPFGELADDFPKRGKRVELAPYVE